VVSQQKTRRRLQTEADSQSRIGRGCLIWGGVLGVVVGAAFAFYGLKPILKHFYGERTVAAGTIYTGSGKELAVTGVTTSGATSNAACIPADADPENIVCVAFRVKSDDDWADLEAKDFSLEVKSQHDWIPASSINEAGGGPVHVTANTPVTVSVHFPAAIGGDPVQPEYLHLTSPRLRFALNE
jgi:hypothetical protein